MAELLTQPGGALRGTLTVAGDKSISHRALLLGALADGVTEVSGFLAGEDCLATLAALEQLGVSIARPSPTDVVVKGVGLNGLRAPTRPLDLGNSGTAIRLMTGVLAGQEFDAQLVGDHSLSQRPMERVASPLRAMGAKIETTDGCPPLRVSGGQRLQAIDYQLPVASAQVKSAVLLAGLYARGETVVTEPAVTRDHTERMLAAFGLDVQRAGLVTRLCGGQTLTGTAVSVPGDLSSAAFFMLAALITPGSELVIENVGLNPTRTGVLEVLRRLGGNLEVIPAANDVSGEPVGRVIVRASPLRGAVIPAALVPLAIDEFPVIFVAAALASGRTVIAGAEELRHKESDRIARMVAGLTALGIDIDEQPDGAYIQGGTLQGGAIDSGGDHRIAMAFASAGAAAAGPIRILDTANVATSFPDFVSRARDVGLSIEASA